MAGFTPTRMMRALDAASRLPSGASANAMAVTPSSPARVAALCAVRFVATMPPSTWMPEATTAKAEAYLEQIAHRMRGHSVIVHKKVVQHGSAAKTILEYASTHGNPVIALATHGRSGLKRALLGSTADKIIRGATMPVLVYHPAEAQ